MGTTETLTQEYHAAQANLQEAQRQVAIAEVQIKILGSRLMLAHFDDLERQYADEPINPIRAFRDLVKRNDESALVIFNRLDKVFQGMGTEQTVETVMQPEVAVIRAFVTSRTRTCPVCGTPFVQTKRSQLYDRTECRQNANYRRWYDKKKLNSFEASQFSPSY